MLYRCKIVIQIDCAGLEGPKITTEKVRGGFIQVGEKFREKKIAFVSLTQTAMLDLPRTANHMQFVNVPYQQTRLIVERRRIFNWTQEKDVSDCNVSDAKFA